MLRVKIDPRTVMSIQNAIPRVIIGIVLVTFSFAIAGFLIDIMWVLIYSMYGIFSSIPGSQLIDEKTMASLNSSSLGFFSKNLGIPGSAWNAAGSIGTIIANMFDNTAGRAISGVVMGMIGGAAIGLPTGAGAIITGLIGGILGGVLGGAGMGTSQVLGFFGQLLAFLVIAFAILWAMFRLWFILLQSYVMILIDIIFAPLWIIAGVMPGRSISFSGWLKDLGANLMAFPATFLMFLIGKTFMDVLSQTKTQGAVFVPPFIGDPGRPDQLAFLIGIAIVLSTPNVVNHTKQLLKAPKIDASTGLQALGKGAAAPQRVVGGLTSAAFAPHYIKDPAGGPDKLWYPSGIKRYVAGILGKH